MDIKLPIEEFSKAQKKDKAQEFYSKTLEIILNTLEDMKDEGRLNFFNEETTRIFPMGDYTNNTFIDENGELEVVIASHNPQIILSNATFLKNLKLAKSKKEIAKINNNGTFDKIIVDFANNLARYFDENTIILLINDGIKVFCYKEYSFKLLIRFATYDEGDENAILNFWDPINRTSLKCDLFLYNENMEKKDKETNGNYKKLVRIYKNIRKNMLINKWASSSELNKYFIELIIYNIPSNLMKKDIIDAYIKSVNYLSNCNIYDFKAFDGSKITNFSLAKLTYANVQSFLNMLLNLIN